MTAGRQPVTVVIDPHEELSPVLFRIEDWLRFCAEPESDDEELLVEVGVRTAGGLGIALEEAARRAPGLCGPDGHSELVPLLPLTGDLRGPLAHVRRASQVAHLADLPADAQRSLDLLGRSARLAGSEDVRALASIAGSEREAVTLSPAQYRTYGRFVRAVLLDPLDRFVAMPPTAEPERTAGPDFGL